MKQREASRRRWGPYGVVGLGLLTATLTPPVARAEPGDHIRVGEAEITPSLLMGVDWHSNVYRTAGELGNEDPPEAGTNLSIGPQLALSLDGPDAILSASGKYGIRKFLVADQSNLDNFGEADVRLNLDVLPNSAVGFKTMDSFRRTNYPTEASDADQALLFRSNALLSGYLAIHPGSALSVDVGATYTFDDYESTSVSETPALNSKNTFGPRAELKWTFFPKTALIADVDVQLARWENHVVTATGDAIGNPEDLGEYIAIPDSNTYKFRAGLVGRFTQRLVLNLITGYGISQYDEDSVLNDPAVNDEVSTELDASVFGADITGLDGLLVATGLEWTPRANHAVTVGYTKGFTDSFFTNFIAYHYPYLKYKALVASRLGLSTEFGYRNESYVGELTRNDHFIKTRLGADYNATDWMDAGLNFGWTRRASADSPPNSTIEYDDFLVGGTLTFSY